MSVASRRRLVALLAALTAFALQPGTVGRAGLDDTPNPDCPAATALPSSAVAGKVLDFNGTLQCFQPGSTNFGGDVAVPPTKDIREAAPQLGDPCQSIYYHAVTFSEDTSATGNPTAHFPVLGGASSGALSVSDAAMIPGSNAYVADTKLGSYELSDPNNPNSPLQCVLNQTFHWYCPNTGVVDSFCFVWQGHDFRVDAPATVPPFFADALGNLQASAGTIHSAPATKGVVNTPVCFWIDGISIPQERDLTLVLPGPIDESGRQIFFTYLARIQFQNITWDFDAPKHVTDVAPVPGVCPGLDPNMNPLTMTAHQYAQISDGDNPDNTYHVTATENYSITVVVYWWNSNGPKGPIPVQPGMAAPTLTPAMYQQYVGQVEGVPIGGQ